MVTLRGGNWGRDRAQLLLAASIIIAVVLVGLSVLLNSVVFTENVSGGSSPEITGDVTEFTREARRNVRGIAIRINHGDNYTLANRIKTRLRENVTAYSHLLAESYADTGSVYVNVSYEGTITEGKRVTQRSDDAFDLLGSANWTAFSDTKDVGWFIANLDAENVSKTTHGTITVNDTAGNTLTLTFRQSDERRLLVNSSIGGTTRNARCTPRNGRVLLDLIEGSSSTGTCSFNGTGALGGSIEELRIENGDAIQGKFSFVVNETSGLGVLPVCPAVNEPCAMPALWAVKAETNYETAMLSYDATHNVSVYDP